MKRKTTALSILTTLALAAWTAHALAQDEDKAIGAYLDTFIAAFNAQNNQGVQDLSAFPHVFSTPDGQLVTYEAPEELVTDYEQLISARDWARTDIDAYDIVQRSATKAHVTVNFSSYTRAGDRYQTSSAIWVLVKKDGQWAVQLRSWLGPDV